MSKRKLRLWCSDFEDRETHATPRLPAKLEFLRKGFDIELDPLSPDYLIYAPFGYNFLRYRCPRIAWLNGENMAPNYGECDFSVSLCPDIPGRNHCLRMYHADMPLLRKRRRSVDAMLAEKTEFCNFIYRNDKCGERNSFYHLLSGYRPVSAAGRLYNNVRGLADVRRADWQEQKRKFMRRYKFTIAFENATAPGYASEKIVDAFLAGSVPIYWGNPDIVEEFNSQAFINCHDFPSLEAVVDYVAAVNQDERLYRRYVAASPLKGEQVPDSCSHKRLFTHLNDFFSSASTPLAHNRDPYWGRWYYRTPRQLLNRRRARQATLRLNAPGILEAPTVFVIPSSRPDARANKLVGKLKKGGVKYRVTDTTNQALSAMVAEQKPYAVIVEDDVTISDDFDTLIKELFYTGVPWDVVTLSGDKQSSHKRSHKTVIAKLGGGQELVLESAMTGDMAAYAVSINAARKLLKAGGLGRRLRFNLKHLALEPRPATYDGRDNKERTQSAYRALLKRLQHLRILFFIWRHNIHRRPYNPFR